MTDEFTSKNNVEWRTQGAPEFKPGNCSVAGCRETSVVTRITTLRKENAPDKTRRHSFCGVHFAVNK